MYRAKVGKWQVSPALQVNRWHVLLGLLTLLLGVLLASQWGASVVPEASSASNTRDFSGATIQRLEEEQKALKARVAALQDEIESHQKATTSRQKTLAGLSQEMERQRMLAGSVALVGSGVKVTLDDSARQPLANDDLNNYLIHDYELRDVINLLWLSGAEAISLNGERMVSMTSLYCVGSTVLVNSTRLSPPYEIVAIGDPAALDDAMNRASSLSKIKANVKSFGIQLKTERLRETRVPAYTGPLDTKYTSVSKQ